MGTASKSWLRLPANLLESIEMTTPELQRSKGQESNVEVSSVNSSDSVGLLHGEVKDAYEYQPRWFEKPVNFFHSKSKRFWAITSATVLFFVLLLSTASTQPQVIKDAYDHITKPKPVIVPTEDRMFYIITPAGHVELPTCRAIVSSAILQYPTMFLVEWDQKLNSTNQTRERNLQKLDQTRKFLADLPEKRSKDLVLILDEPDSWFQLRPEVLLQRYLDINNRANEQLERTYGGVDALESLGIRQNIVFTASRTCASNSTTECTTAPSAPEPLRARFLSAGLHIGPVRELLALYEHAFALGSTTSSWPSIPALMTTIFSAQESQRRRVLETDNPASLPEKSALTGLLPDDFTIGLDYTGALSFPALSLPDLVPHNPSANTSLLLLPPDILASQPPFWTLEGTGSAGRPDNTPWEALPLLAHKATRMVPGIVHVGTDLRRGGAVGEERWTRFWMAGKVRALLGNAVRGNAGSTAAAAVVVDPRTAREVRFWSPEWQWPGIRVGGQYKGWAETDCDGEEWGEKIFGDGRGRWEGVEI